MKSELFVLCCIFFVVYGKVAVRSSSNDVINAIMQGEKGGQSRFDVFHDECLFEEEERLECGKRTYDERECRTRGCCWQTCEGCHKDVPWCFLAKRMVRPECAVAYEEKDDCGYYGMTEGECYMRGCCWAPSPLANSPPCFHKAKGSDVRLADGDGEHSGRVEVLHEGVWGTVCDDDFDQAEATVICKSLGFQFGHARQEAHFGEGSGEIWLDDISCRGDEESLADCSHNGWGNHNCGHSEDAGVVCSNGEQSSESSESSESLENSESSESSESSEMSPGIRLVNGYNTYNAQEGRLEIYYAGEWGTVCDDDFDMSAARVVCRCLGYSEGVYYGNAIYGEGTGPIWLDEINCSGNEDSLEECSHGGWGSHNCNHSEDVGVACSAGGSGSGQSSEYDMED